MKDQLCVLVALSERERRICIRAFCSLLFKNIHGDADKRGSEVVRLSQRPLLGIRLYSCPSCIYVSVFRQKRLGENCNKRCKSSAVSMEAMRDARLCVAGGVAATGPRGQS